MEITAYSKAQIEAPLFNKAPTAILAEYSNYSNIFLAENTSELLKYTRINNHIIKLEENK